MSTATCPPCSPARRKPSPEVHPFERRQAVAVTLEQSYDDWYTAQLARALATRPIIDSSSSRARPTTKMSSAPTKTSCGRRTLRATGSSPSIPSSPAARAGAITTTENNGYTYDWDVQHDLQGLFQLMGGTRKAEAKLDQLFRERLGPHRKYEFWAKFPDATGLVGQFSMGNEPSLAHSLPVQPSRRAVENPKARAHASGNLVSPIPLSAFRATKTAAA